MATGLKDLIAGRESDPKSLEVSVASADHLLKRHPSQADVSVPCGDFRVECHSDVLSASSPFFKPCQRGSFLCVNRRKA